MDQLESRGWYIEPEQYKLWESERPAKTSLEEHLLNIDLKEISKGGLPEEVSKTKCTKIQGPIVLQIQKIHNVSAPSYRQESNTAPRMFLFCLTDGKQQVSAVELENLSNINFNTSPGCKVLLRGSVQVSDGFILLNNSNCKHLGGKVDHLYEKWITKKSLLMIDRNVNRVDGPPPFVPFGQKIHKQQIQQLSGKFKSLEIANQTGTGPEKDNSEFDAQRQAEIQEALQQVQSVKKTYGGIKQADTDEPLQRAEFKRPEKKSKKPALEDKDPNVSDDEENRGGRGRRGRRRHDSADGPINSKPTTGNTLFDFLNEKIGDSSSAAGSSASVRTDQTPSAYNRNDRYSNSGQYTSNKPTNHNTNDRPNHERNSYYNSTQDAKRRPHSSVAYQHREPAANQHREPAANQRRDQYSEGDEKNRNRYQQNRVSSAPHTGQVAPSRPQHSNSYTSSAHQNADKQQGRDIHCKTTNADKTDKAQQRDVNMPAVGDIVQAMFWEDKQFYRFKILKFTSDDMVFGEFIDYRDQCHVKLADIKTNKSAPRQQQQQQRNSEQHRGQDSKPPGRKAHEAYQGDFRQGMTFSRSRQTRNN